MIIPINLESENSVQTVKRASQPTASSVVTFPITKRNGNQEKVVSFRDLLIPVLSKYFQHQNFHADKCGNLLDKKHPLNIQSFKEEGDKYKLTLDVVKFKPEEIHIKIKDHWISILGKHEDKIDDLNYSRQEFFRKYTLPNEVDPDDITCEVRADGYLVILAPKITNNKVQETSIPLRLTGPAKCI